MSTIRDFFNKNQDTFFNFQKEQGRPLIFFALPHAYKFCLMTLSLNADSGEK